MSPPSTTQREQKDLFHDRVENPKSRVAESHREDDFVSASFVLLFHVFMFRPQWATSDGLNTMSEIQVKYIVWYERK